MFLGRRNVKSSIANVRTEAVSDAFSESYTQLLQKRAPRDSYSQERPLLCVPFELPSSLLDDLDDGAMLDDERRVHVCPTVRPSAK